MHNKKHKFRTSVLALCMAGGVLAVQGAAAAELSTGTVISAANIDQVKSDTFEGHTIESLLTEKIEWRIRNSGMEITLGKSSEVPLDPRWVKASQENSGRASINKQECRVDGWGAGAPFQEIDMNDADAAEKIMWNWH